MGMIDQKQLDSLLANIKNSQDLQKDQKLLAYLLAYVKSHDEILQFQSVLPDALRNHYKQLLSSSKMKLSRETKHSELPAINDTIRKEWYEYVDETDQREIFKKFITVHRKKVGLDVPGLYHEIGIRHDTWYKYLDRVGRAATHDKEYTLRLCFILQLHIPEVYRLLEMTHHTFIKTDKRDFCIYKLLEKQVYDRKNVDASLEMQKVAPLFKNQEEVKDEAE